MTISIIGQLATAAGHAQQYDALGTPDPSFLRADSFRAMQPRDLPLLMEHTDWTVGQVQYLERSAVDGLMCVATIESDIADREP